YRWTAGLTQIKQRRSRPWSISHGVWGILVCQLHQVKQRKVFLAEAVGACRVQCMNGAAGTRGDDRKVDLVGALDGAAYMEEFSVDQHRVVVGHPSAEDQPWVDVAIPE